MKIHIKHPVLTIRYWGFNIKYPTFRSRNTAVAFIISVLRCKIAILYLKNLHIGKSVLFFWVINYKYIF